MSPALPTHTLLARQANEAAGFSSDLRTLAIVGTCLGGSAFLFLLCVGIFQLWHVRRSSRLESIRKNTTATSFSDPNHLTCGVPWPRTSLPSAVQLRNNSTTVWGMLPSEEDLQAGIEVAKRRPMKNVTDVLSWPIPRRFSARRIRLTRKPRDSQLSDILESPQSLGLISKNGNPQPPLPAELECIPTNMIGQNRSETSAGVVTSSPQMPPPAAIPPEKQFHEYGTSDDWSKGRQLARCFSGPPVLTEVPSSIRRDSEPSLLSCGDWRPLRCREKWRSAPSAPLPPLPDPGRNRREPDENLIRHPTSAGSISSFESFGTSILNSPNERLSFELSKKHTGMIIRFQTKESTPTTKRRLMTGAGWMSSRSRVSKGPRINPVLPALRNGSSRNNREHKRQSPGGVAKHKKRNSGTRLSIGPHWNGHEFAFNRPESQVCQVDNTVGGVTPPKRDSRVSRLSDALGSPIERSKGESFNLLAENNPMPPREVSQTSQDTASTASPANPFQWDSSPTGSSMPSSLMASPTKKTHRRQGSVRPARAAVNGAPASRSTSSSKMIQIAEDTREHSSEISPFSTRPPVWSAHADNVPAREEVSESFRDSLELSLMPPPLSSVKLEHERENNTCLSSSSCQESVHSLGKIEGQEENKAPAIEDDTIVVGESSVANRGRATESVAAEGECSLAGAATSSVLPRPRQYIPGLSLITQDSQKSLRDSLSEFMPSPYDECPEVLPGSPVLPCPPTPRPAQEPFPSSPPVPRNLSPPLKSAPTTCISQAPPTIQSYRITPLSSTIHAVKGRPVFLPPGVPDSQALAQAHPSIPRATPAPDVLKPINALRHMSGNTLHLFHRPEPSAKEGNFVDNQFAMPQLDYEEMAEEKENQVCGIKTYVWDDEDDFWISTSSDDRKHHAEPEMQASKAVEAAKKVAWGGIEVRENGSSIKSDGRPSFCEDDFF